MRSEWFYPVSGLISSNSRAGVTGEEVGKAHTSVFQALCTTSGISCMFLFF